MARYLLDSDAIIDYLRGVAPASEILRRLSAQGESLCICSVVVAEVFTGASASTASTIEEFLAAFTYLPTTAQMARQAGEWRHDYARRGQVLATADVLIAATAHGHRATLVTGNIRHFPMPELQILPLSRSR